jgi:subtilisin family serine protease
LPQVRLVLFLSMSFAITGVPLVSLGSEAIGDGVDATHILVHFEAEFSGAHAVRFGGAIDNGPLDTLIQTWGVTGIRPLLVEPARDAALAERYGLNRVYVFTVAQGTDVRAMAAAFSAAPGVALAETDGVGGIAETIPNDPGFSLQWPLRNAGQTGGSAGADIGATFAWDLGVGSSAITIAVLDTGIQADHPDLLGKVIPGYNFYDMNNDTSDPHGHGTHVAGIAGAIGNNGVGIAGVDWNVRLLAVTVVSDSGSGTESPVAAAVVWAADQGADVINMSLQYAEGSVALRNAVAYAYDAGVLPIAAAGNAGSSTVAYPARFPKCMAIGATNHSDLRWSSSNFGPEIDVVAPGADVYSLNRNSGYRTRSGTSMATPHVSGLASLILSAGACLTPPEIEGILRDSAVDLGPPGFDVEYGYGRIEAPAALLAAHAATGGDLNCDCAIDAFDIEPFILAMTDPTGYAVHYPGCDWIRADVNGDGAVDAFDIAPFIERLLP